MKKILLPLMALGIVLTSCSRDNDDSISNPIVNPIKLEDLLAEISGNFYTTINYNDDKISSSIGIDGNTTYTYTNNLITSISRDRGMYGKQNIQYTYYPDGNLKTASEIFVHSMGTYFMQTDLIFREILTREYIYNGDQVNVKETRDIYSNQDTDKIEPTAIVEYNITMKNGNIIRKEVTGRDILKDFSNQYSYTSIYRYDNKVNPLSKIKGLSALQLELNLIDYQNNAGAENIHITSSNNNLIYSNIDGHENSINYEYNSKGYPIKKSETNTFSTPTTYIYKQ